MDKSQFIINRELNTPTVLIDTSALTGTKAIDFPGVNAPGTSPRSDIFLGGDMLNTGFQMRVVGDTRFAGAGNVSQGQALLWQLAKPGMVMLLMWKQ